MLHRLALLLLIAASSACASIPAGTRGRPQFVYDDLDRFAVALRAIDAGTEPRVALEAYVAGASPAFPFFAQRYGATAETMARAIARRPRHYRQVAALRPRLRAFEAEIRRGLSRLGRLASDNRPAPIYYLVANLSAGGSPSELRPPSHGHAIAVAIGVETVARTDATDMSEFPGPYGGAYLADIPYVAVHEMMHIYQARLQGLDNYRSIYRPGPNNIDLALAVREGCADYVTFLATGRRRTGNQQSYGLANERALWRRFRDVMDQPASFDDGWFGPLNPATPDWPPQIGYWLGSRICQAYHEDSPDRAQAMRDIFNAYLAEDMRRIAAAYARRMGG